MASAGPGCCCPRRLLITGTGVAVTGVIGFVGLIVPHSSLDRRTRPPLLLPASARGRAVSRLGGPGVASRLSTAQPASGRGHGVCRCAVVSLYGAAQLQGGGALMEPAIAARGILYYVAVISGYSTASISPTRDGEFVGLLGPNGAGKSTLLRRPCRADQTFDGNGDHRRR